MRILFLFTTLVALWGCRTSDKNQINLYEYSKNDLISTKEGVLLDSTVPFAPLVLKNNDSIFYTGIDTNLNKQHLQIAWRNHVGSILYNYFTGTEKIEMYYSGVWSNPVLVSFCRSGNEYWIQSQSIEKSRSQIRNPQLKINFAKPISDDETLIQYQPISIERSLWDSLKYVLAVNGFNTGKRTIIKAMLDGSAMLVQVHLKDGYNFFARNYYSDSTQRIQDFFLDQAGFKILQDTSNF